MYENLMKNDTPMTEIDSHIIEHSAGLVDSILNEDEELQHWGIKGQKWGVRRYQNKDGSLTPEGKKRLSKEYEKRITKVSKDIEKSNDKRTVDAYGKAIDELNNGPLQKYNNNYAKKLGKKADTHDFMNDEKYNNGIDKMIDDLTEKHYNTALARDIENHPDYKKAKELCDKYGMTSFDELAKITTKEYDDILKRQINHSDFDISEDEEYLAHHGTKGMKWGIRNYQNKDGSLTPAGRKRYGSFSDAIKKYKKKKQLKKAREAKAAKEAAAKQRAEDIKQGRIKPKDMSLDELMNAKKRLEMERDYKKLFDQLNPPDKVVEEGKSFAKKFWDEAAKPAMVTAGKTLLTDALNKEVKKIVGDKADKAMEKLKKEADKLDLESKIQRAKKNIASDERQEWNQKRGFEEDKEKAAKANQGKNQARSAEEYEKTNSQYSKKNDNSNNSITDPTYRTPEYFIKNNLLLTGPTFEKNVNSGKDIVDSILDRNDIIGMDDDDNFSHSADISEEELQHWGII